MKDIYYLVVALCLLLTPIDVSAQMQQQQAIVKTHARQRLDGTTSKCEYVSSALVTIKDEAQLVSDEQGELFFNVDAKSCYYISSAYKQGYKVTDMSVLTNGHYYSGNEPLLIYMQNIAEIYKTLGDYSQALEYFIKSETVFAKIYGEEHIETVSLYGVIGLIYYTLGSYSEALEYLTKVEAVFSKIYGEENKSLQHTRFFIQDIKNRL